ncbi:MAG TPA: cupredoxin family copper-binding protein [Paludibacter sp.]|nr:cupredoxin family copper-binding protein [Paludibacter sp.]
MKTTNKRTGIRILIVPVLMCIFCILNSCTSKNDPVGNTPTPGTNSVTIQNMAFSPATITVTAGATVKWTNMDAIAHTVTSDTPLFDSGSLVTNGVYSYTFTTAGTYNYHCTFHSMMTGKVIVNAASSSGY